jgi:stage II sporulation protein AA (anti-sigma F factor antagonist)
MQINFEKNGRILIVNMTGELDHHSAENVRYKIDNNIDNMGYPNLIFNFAGINFMDSSGIGVIIGRYRKVSEYGGKVGIINMKTDLRRIFELGGIFKIIKEYKSYEDAVSNF